uniref:Cytotoxic and regulatory T cell molecule n=1 Tax=Pelusios castaneus TaxID=367368 RepID=A0A8C8RKC9_9SAUR
LHVHTERVTVEEGQDLTLPCVFHGGNESALQWLDPWGFVIFLNSHRGLRDWRYKLIHSSKDELSINLSNITVQDEGTYTCFFYDVPVRTKKVNVTVLAAPSKPLLEVSDVRTDGKEEKIVLSCITQGSKPPPQITWLLDNGLEVYGDTKHKFEHDGKKCNTTSTLTVHAYNWDSTASCVIRHETLRGEKLTVSFQFEHFMTTTDSIANASEINTMTFESPQHYLGMYNHIKPQTLKKKFFLLTLFIKVISLMLGLFP